MAVLFFYFMLQPNKESNPGFYARLFRLGRRRELGFNNVPRLAVLLPLRSRFLRAAAAGYAAPFWA
jgi:hypothetical protein